MSVMAPPLAAPIAEKRLRDQQLKISESIRFATEHDDGDVECRKMLLEREIAIDRNENLELFRGQRKQLPVLDRRPSHLARRLDFVTE